MKSLVESLFDSDLVSKDTGYEYLYSFVKFASVFSEYKIEYFDERKIKRDFNSITKKFPPQQWSDNPWTGMNKFQKMDNNEILRELLYIIVCNIKTVDVIQNDNINSIKIENLIKDIIYEYIDNDYKRFINVIIMNDKHICSVRIGFKLGTYGTPIKEAGVIRIHIDTFIS